MSELVQRSLSFKAVSEDLKDIAATLNREVVPVLRRVRELMNSRVWRSYAETVGDGSSVTFSIEHELDTSDVIVEAYTISTGVTLAPSSVTRVSDSEVSVTFGVAPATDDCRVLVRS